MRRTVKWILGPVVLVLALNTAAFPQGSTSPARPTALPVKVQVVLTKNEGLGKVVMPYTLFTSSSGEVSSLRMGAEVAIPATGAAGQFPYTMQQFGMQIDCTVRGVDGRDVLPAADGPFKVSMTITKRDVYDPNLSLSIPQRAGSMPALYNFIFAGTLVLRNGGTAQISATDIVTNETWTADITVSVKK
jgi:hypothetical protein